MDKATFWQTIDKARQNTTHIDEQIAVLHEMLLTLSPDEIASFDTHFDEVYQASFSPALWERLTDIFGFVSDDSFDYFRAWLVSRGEKIYTNVLNSPAYIGDIITGGNTECLNGELFMYVAYDAYKKLTGINLQHKKFRATLKALGIDNGTI